MKHVSEKKPRKEKSGHAQQGEKPYLYWPNGDSIRKAADSSIVVKDEEGLCVFAMEGCEWLSDHVLEGIAQLACAEDTTKNTEAMF